MKGTIVIESDGEHIRMSGTMLFRGKTETYEVISGLSKSLGINDATSWAECVLYCLSRVNDLEGLNRTEIVIPTFGGTRDEGEN